MVYQKKNYSYQLQPLFSQKKKPKNSFSKKLRCPEYNLLSRLQQVVDRAVAMPPPQVARRRRRRHTKASHLVPIMLCSSSARISIFTWPSRTDPPAGCRLATPTSPSAEEKRLRVACTTHQTAELSESRRWWPRSPVQRGYRATEDDRTRGKRDRWSSARLNPRAVVVALWRCM